MSKHTPGPWFIGTDRYDYGRHIYAEQKVGDEYCEEYHPLIATTSDDEPDIDWEANARLIAAAPELLKALEIVEPIIDEVMASVEPGRMARAAIAKARGEE